MTSKLESESSDASGHTPDSGGSASSARRPAMVIGTLVLIAGTVVAALQSPHHPPVTNAGMLTRDWWLYPVERNALRRVALVPGSLHAVFALSGTSLVWVVGDGGLVARSADGGRTWASTNLTAELQQEPSAAPAAKTNRRADASRSTDGPRAAGGAAAQRVAHVRGRQSSFRVVSVAFASDAVGGVPPSSELEAIPAQPQQQQQQQQQTVTSVPYVVGMSFDAAVKTLAATSLRVVRVDTVDGGAKPGVVLAQSPSAGTRVPAASSIVLRVSVSALGRNPAAPAKTPTPTPNVGPSTPNDSKRRADTTSGANKRSDSISTQAGSTVAPPALVRDTTKFFPRLYGVCFTDARSGWVIGERGALFATTDGGAQWKQVRITTSGRLEAIACRAGVGAVAVGENGETLRSVDDSTWNVWARVGLTRPQLSILPDRSVWAISQANAIGRPVGTSAPGSLVRFRDDARPSRVGSDTADRAWTVAFIDAKNGFAGTATRGLVVTQDGGASWRPATCAFRIANDTGASVRSIVPVTATSAMAVDAQNRVWTTNDAWRTCSPGAVFANSTVTLASASPDRWYAVANGALFSRDAAGPWRALIGGSLFSSLTFVDRERGFAGLSTGGIARTSNAGHTWRTVAIDSQRIAPVRHLAARTPEDLYAAAGEVIYRSSDAGATWRRYASTDSVVSPVHFADSLVGWGRRHDTTWVTRDAGANWDVDTSTNPVSSFAALDSSDAHSVAAGIDTTGGGPRLWGVTRHHRLLSFDGKGWVPVAGASMPLSAAAPIARDLAFGLDSLGSLVRSVDGGVQWAAVDLTQRKFPAPWYYPFVFFCVGATALVVHRDEKEKRARHERSVADILVSDRPLREGDRDILDFGKIAAGLSRFLRNTRTQPPLTIAVTGPWGTGKSSLMNLLRRDLQERSFRTVWFNAWHHQREESLLASLLESVRQTASPPVWTIKGIRFRVRLLWARFSRYAVPLLVLFPLFALAVGYILRHPAERLHDLADAFWSFRHFFTHDASADGAVADTTRPGGQQKTLLALIISIGGAAVTYARGLKAFGVNPADLVKSVASAGQVPTIQTPPAFRYRFAQDFREVTNALKPERLVVFIDDLDRCKPDQVLEILEAVNFLVDSGDCVVVLGIDRERVTGCVAIGFKEVASVLAGMEQKQPVARNEAQAVVREVASAGVTPLRRTPDTPQERGTPETDDAKALGGQMKSDMELQVDYARHYLEKLLNMEIPIPAATAEGLGNVMTNTTGQPVPAEPFDSRMRRYKLPLFASVAAIATVVTFVLGYRGERFFERAVVPPTVVGTAAVVSSVAPIGGVDQVPPGAPVTTQTDSTLSTTPMTLAIAPLPTTVWWEHVLILAAAAAALIWLLTPREDKGVQDSDTFSDALRAWAPVLFEEFRTPRAAKRFLNHVRFLAMAQRAPAARRTPVARALDGVKRLPLIRNAVEAFGEKAPDEEELLRGSIPEAVLVSLSVIAERYPEWLDDDAFWRSDLESYVTKTLGVVPDDLKDALEQLGGSSEVGNATRNVVSLPQFAAHRETWNKLIAWVQT